MESECSENSLLNSSHSDFLFGEVEEEAVLKVSWKVLPEEVVRSLLLCQALKDLAYLSEA